MKLEESQGIVTQEGKQWNDLADLITDYIFDIQNGLNADPFYDTYNISIKKSNISSYYKYKYHKNIDSTTIIPDWVGKFEIRIIDNTKSKGSFDRPNAELVDNKLNFIVKIDESNTKTADEFRETLVHEFRHAYTKWLELTNNFQQRTYGEQKLYSQVVGVMASIVEQDEYHILDTIKTYTLDNIILKDKVFTDPTEISNIITASLYYTDKDEIHCFLQEFAMSIRNLLKANRDKIVEKIKESNNLKTDFNLLAKPQQWCSNVLNNIDLTNYSSQYFRIYKALDIFWTNINKIDENNILQALTKCSKIVKMYLHLPIGNKLVKFDGDGMQILKLILNTQLTIIKKVLLQMNKIFADMILNILLDDKKAKEKIDNDITNSDIILNI